MLWREKCSLYVLIIASICIGNADGPSFIRPLHEQEIRPSVIFRKVTNGFRSDWGPGIHAGYRSVTGTARRQGQSAWTAIRNLIDGTFIVA